MTRVLVTPSYPLPTPCKPEDYLLHPRILSLYDSGPGAIETAVHFRAGFANNPLVLYIDNANAPYGERSSSFINARRQAAFNRLYKEGARLICIACNSASATCNCERFRGIPVVSVIAPTAMEIVESWRPGMKILILSTTRTYESGAYPREIARLSPSAAAMVTVVPAPKLVELINKRKYRTQEALNELHERIGEEEWAVIGLCCTHFAICREHASDCCRNATIITSGPATVRYIKENLIHDEAPRQAPTRPGTTRILCTGDVAEILPIAEDILGAGTFSIEKIEG